MRTTLQEARKSYLAGNYYRALKLYHALASKHDHRLFYANVALCIRRLSEDRALSAGFYLQLVRNKRFDILRESLSGRVVVSLTSYPARIGTVAETVESLLRQTFKAGKVV